MSNYARRLWYLCLQATREGQASHAHVHEIIAGLARRGWRVELFEPSSANRPSDSGQAGRLWGFISTQLRLLLRVDRPDVLYIRAHFAAFPTALAARLARIPVVQEVNGLPEELPISWPWTRHLSWLFGWMSRVQLRWAQAIVVVTPGLRDWVVQQVGAKSVYVIPNGVNIELFRPDAASQQALGAPYVIFFGALARWQGIDVMLAATELPQWPQDLKLLIVGDGVEREKIRAAARRSTKIVYLGKVPYRQVPGLVAASLAALVPKNRLSNGSVTGLFPLKLFEAMACGVPVVVTDFPGQADLVRKSGCGVVIPPEDPRALAEAVAYFYHNPDVRIAMGQAGRQAVERDHSWDRRAAATETVLLRVSRNGCRSD